MTEEKLKINIGAVITEPGSSIQNKTGSWRSLRPIIDRDKCIKCGKCWQFCPDSAIIIDKEGKAVINYNYCKGCLICQEVCPPKCISAIKEEK